MAKKSFVIHKGTPDFNLEYSNISLSRSGDNLIAKITDAQLHLDSGYYWFYYRVAIKLTLYSDAARTNEITSEERTFITKPKPIDFYKDPNGFAVSGSNEKCWFDAKGSYAKNGYFPKNSVTGEVSIDVSTYTGTIYADVLVYGESDSGDTTDLNMDGVADQDCPCSTHGEAIKNGTFTLWTDVNAGSIDIVDNGDNTFTIDATSGSAGIGNDVHLNSIFYKIVPSGTEANSISYTSDDDYDFTSGTKTMTKTISGPCTVYAFVRTYGTEYGTPANPGGDVRNKADSATDSQGVSYYTFPTPPTKIWINTGKAAQYPNNIKTSLPAINDGTNQLTANNACKPRNKEILMWKWDGATKGGGAAAIDGFRVYIHKIAKGTTGSPATKTPDNTINLSGKTLYEIENEGKSTEALDTYTSTETSKGSNTMYGFYCDIPYVSGEANDAQFGFIPKDLGFNAGDLCYCEVFTYNTWGDGDRRYSKASITDTDYVPIIGACNIFNGATVWVRVPRNPPTDNTLVWKEGTVYVYNGSTWKEAEGVYVRDGGKWKEST